jgi:pyruvate/2-oxoglutarate/acetoin dehydrogenase E1 component
MYGCARLERCHHPLYCPVCVQAVTASVNKTGRVLVSHEAPLTSGFAAELVAEISSRCFLSLEAPPVRVSMHAHMVVLC